MHYIYVQLDDFYLLNSQAAPLIVLREKRVIGRNGGAESRGVKLGMSESHARALASQAEFQHWKQENYLEQQEKWLNICAQYSGVIEPEDQHTANIDLSLHPSPVNVALALTDELAKNYQVQAGIANSKWLAKLAAGENRLEVVDPREFLADLPLDKLTPVAPEHIQRLKFFGYRTIGEVAGIQLATLKQQFDQDAIKIRLAAQGRLQDPVKPLYPRDSFIDSLMFDSLIDSLETLDEAFVSLSKRLGKRLREKDLWGADLHVEIEFENRTQTFQRRFAKPIKCPLSMLSALRLLLQGELKEPVSAIRIRLPKLERTRNAQADLLGKSEKAKSMDSALHSLRTAFGDRVVQNAKDVQLPRRMKVLKEWKDALGWR